MAERIIPGVYTTVRSEGLISAPAFGVSTIGIVGTANKGEINEPIYLSSSDDVSTYLGTDETALTLVRALDQAYKNGAGSVIAIRIADTNAAKATVTITDETDITDTLVLTAKTEGTYGNGFTVTITTTSTPTADNIVTITDSATGDTELYTGADAEEIASLINNITTGSSIIDATVLSGQGASNLFVQASTPFTGGDNGDAVGNSDYIVGLAKLEEVEVQIINLAGQSDATLHANVVTHCNNMSDQGSERSGVVGGTLAESVATIIARMASIDSDRLVMVAKGIKATSLITGLETTLSAAFASAAVAGLLAGNDPQVSITNKTLSGVTGIEAGLSRTAIEQLIQARVCVIYQRNGIRIAKGITTSTNSSWHQITTRRIVDAVKIGTRGVSDPYVGTLNIISNRTNLSTSISGFLNAKKNENMLVDYTLAINATRADEIAGRVRVDITVQPVFSIDFIEVTLVLE